MLAPLCRGTVGQSKIPGQVQRGASGDSFALMETVIDNAESSFRSVNRFNSLLTSGSNHSSLPVRHENQSMMRVRRSCLADPDTDPDATVDVNRRLLQRDT